MYADTSPARPRAAAGRGALTLRGFAPVVVALVLVAPSMVWIALDRSIWPWDPSWYGNVSVDLWATLTLDPGRWPGLMTNVFGSKPPAVAWLGQFFVPLDDVLGSDATALLLSVVLTQAVTVTLVYVALRRLSGDAAALVAALLVAASPLFVSMSHEYFAEPVQTLSIAWLLLVLASSRRWRPALTLTQLPGVVALGLLAKLSTPLYMAAPVLATLVLVTLHRRDERSSIEARRDPAVLASGALSAALLLGALGWYQENLDTAVAHARLASADTGLYGVDSGFAAELPDWVGRIRDAAFLPWAWLPVAALATASVAFAWRRRGGPTVRDPRLLTAAACALSLVLVLAALASQPNQEVRYVLPLVPFVAALAALGVAASRVRALVAAAAAILVVEFALVTLQSFGRADVPALTTYPLRAPVTDSSFAAALDEVVEDTCTADAANRISMVGSDYPWLNHNNLTMQAFQEYAEDGRRCYYTALGYAAEDPEVAWQRLVEFDSPYYISIDYGNPANPLPAAQQATIRPDDPFNRVNHAVFERVVASGLYDVVPGSRREGLVILHRRTAS